jgi:hypothetical protein
MDKQEWEALKEEATSLFEQTLMYPYEYREFDREDVPSDEHIKKCKELIDRAKNDRAPLDELFRSSVTEKADPNIFPNPFRDQDQT